MLVDFHTHTRASDGQLSPQKLMRAARERGVEVLAITDHDTVAGYLAVQGDPMPGLSLVSGAELSCVWGGVNIHVVALGFDPSSLAMTDMLARLGAAREQRAATIGARLEKLGMPGAFEGARALAAGAQLGRPHFAQWMLDTGHVEDTGKAFDKFLGRGMPGDVKVFWPALTEVVEAIVAAGGAAVLAHPLHYKLTRMKLHALCKAFVDAGGKALEVLSGRQTEADTRQLRILAAAHGLQASVGSDFHRPFEHGPKLGVDASQVGELRPVWEALL